MTPKLPTGVALALLLTVLFGAASAGTDLHKAAESNNAEKIKHLVTQGANIDAKDNAVDRVGWTPLHVAVYSGHLEAVTALIESGADLQATTGAIQATTASGAVESVEGVTPIVLAHRMGRKEVAALLLARDPRLLSWLREHELSVHTHLTLLRALGVETFADLAPLKGLSLDELYADIADGLDGTARKATTLPCAPRCAVLKAAVHKALNADVVGAEAEPKEEVKEEL